MGDGWGGVSILDGAAGTPPWGWGQDPCEGSRADAFAEESSKERCEASDRSSCSRDVW